MQFENHWTNKCTSEDKNTLKKNDSNCNPPSWRCHKPVDEHKKLMDCHKCKKEIASLLAAMETHTVAGIVVTEY
eukprot:9422082-Ditylum_brightwellii.AAC.1